MPHAVQIGRRASSCNASSVWFDIELYPSKVMLDIVRRSVDLVHSAAEDCYGTAEIMRNCEERLEKDIDIALLLHRCDFASSRPDSRRATSSVGSRDMQQAVSTLRMGRPSACHSKATELCH